MALQSEEGLAACPLLIPLLMGGGLLPAVVPHIEQVVVAARGELRAPRRPAQATDLLRVTAQRTASMLGDLQTVTALQVSRGRAMGGA